MDSYYRQALSEFSFQIGDSYIWCDYEDFPVKRFCLYVRSDKMIFDFYDYFGVQHKDIVAVHDGKVPFFWSSNLYEVRENFLYCCQYLWKRHYPAHIIELDKVYSDDLFSCEVMVY